MDENIILQELKFRTSRSSGSGGQHVNKVSTKVELLFDITRSGGLSEDEKVVISEKLANRISNEGILILVCQESRSQYKNKELVTERFLTLIQSALRPEKKREPTLPPPETDEERLRNKKAVAEKKRLRREKFRNESEEFLPF
ncbi:MAG: aminoacyl-tRNA hydrolase [Bacteroidetes bacterium]|nr:aminoacyl-tRNA hydrolase [Bacteroidota bacterium]